MALDGTSATRCDVGWYLCNKVWLWMVPLLQGVALNLRLIMIFLLLTDHVILPGEYMPPPPPPPPMAPAPPPPPPVPGAGTQNAMQLKRINWEKLSGVGIENTVWGRVSQSSVGRKFLLFGRSTPH